MDSHVDQPSSDWAIESLNEDVSCVVGVTFVPWRPMNDCCDAKFNTITKEWPWTVQGQCCWRMGKQILKSCGQCLRDKSNLNKTHDDVKKLQSCPFPSMSDRLHESLKKKCNEPAFLSSLKNHTGT